MGIVVPVVFSETNAPGNFVLCLYLNKALPIAGGREIWGYPKKDAEITFVEKNGELTGRMERLGTVLLNLRGKLEKRIERDPREPRTPYFVEKIIPSARKNAPPDVWQLVSSPVVNAKTHELWSGTVELEFKSGPNDPLASIELVRVQSAQFSVSDFTLDYGEVLHNYLTERKSKTSATNLGGKAPDRN